GATLAAARRGEPWAQRAFVLRFQVVVHRLCARMLGHAGRERLAEDVTQDALVRIVRALPGFVDDGAAKLSTWVLTIATRTVIDELRRQRPEPIAFDALVLAGDDRADLVAERRAIARAIALAVDELSPEIRAAFVLRAYHDLGHAEIATALEIDVGTVKSRLWRARAALQARLQEVRRG
ncbi:MAG: sigma-70 family RNA polymerase sigma factor, partial [Deltaproteobacteria bacterium]|nr:sigma-70 family RNA polymerase sigma factor [Nannocystaceae bacterium]